MNNFWGNASNNNKLSRQKNKIILKKQLAVIDFISRSANFWTCTCMSNKSTMLWKLTFEVMIFLC